MKKALIALLLCSALFAQTGSRYFVISAVDSETGRGVPLAELKTTSEVTYFTDSGGRVAFYEPGLMGQKVFFYVKSDGYEYPQDELGNRGTILQVVPGGEAVLKLKRVNIAERLYRVTGEGIYRDTLLAGRKAPLKNPAINAQVTGQDTVMVAPYRGKLYWFWGDTDFPSYPLGNFAATGATSELPGRGGLDPAVGVDLDYFTQADGFVKPMLDIPGEGMKWLFGLMTLADHSGHERLLARYYRMKGLDEVFETGLALFDDDVRVFRRLVEFPKDTKIGPDGRPFRVSVRGKDYYYFSSPYPLPCIRVKADWDEVQHIENYEAYTCYAPGKGSLPERDADGKLVCGWKQNSFPMTWEEQKKLIASGKLSTKEAMWQLRDIDTGEPIEASAGVYWNAYRNRWIAILQKNVGAVYFAEGDTPVGPWVYAKKVMQHDNYTFYWPTQHPFFDQDGGRIIYFEGTYTDSFSSARTRTPRYNYNQLMYRLRLDDDRLRLPAPVYRLRGGEYRMRDGVYDWSKVESLDFFALPPKQRGTTTSNAASTWGRTWKNAHAVLFLDREAEPSPAHMGVTTQNESTSRPRN